MTFKPNIRRVNGGYLVVLLLVFGAVFFTIFSAFMGFVTTGKRLADTKFHSEQSLQIAEAGLNYYKWFLSHYPDDIKNGTTTPGPYVLPYLDPEGGRIGEYSLSIDGNLSCGEVTSIDITSTGHTDAEPTIKRSIFARYSRPNVAEYSHIVNANVWAGPDRQVYGPYHSNGFVRMDGVNNSKVTSGQSRARCQDVDVCEDTNPPFASGTTYVNGVFGSGPRSDLWVSAAPPISFTGVTVDLSVMLDKAKNGGGRWFDVTSGQRGYYVVFNNNGTFTVRRITQNKGTTNAQGYARNYLNSATLVGTYSVPSGCAVLFFEDSVWVEGTVKGKVTMAAARPNSSTDPSITLVGNLTYADSDSGLLLVGEQDVSIGLDVPTDMSLNGIFIAQKGTFSRPHFTTGSCGSTAPCIGSVPSNLSSHIFKNSLTTNGTVVSNGRVGTKWISSGGSWVSGFNTRLDYYDRDLAIDPPPLTPKTSDNYQFIEWREMEQ